MERKASRKGALSEISLGVVGVVSSLISNWILHVSADLKSKLHLTARHSMKVSAGGMNLWIFMLTKVPLAKITLR